MFKDSDYEFLQIIECLKATGMPLKDIKEFIYMVQRGNESIGDRLQLFYKQKAEVEKQIVSLQKTLDVINFKCWYYETAKKQAPLRYLIIYQIMNCLMRYERFECDCAEKNVQRKVYKSLISFSYLLFSYFLHTQKSSRIYPF